MAFKMAVMLNWSPIFKLIMTVFTTWTFNNDNNNDEMK